MLHTRWGKRATKAANIQQTIMIVIQNKVGAKKERGPLPVQGFPPPHFVTDWPILDPGIVTDWPILVPVKLVPTLRGIIRIDLFWPL